HRRNAHGFERILGEIREHPCVIQWNVFQYTPTDQTRGRVNQELRLDDLAFARLGDRLLSAIDARPAGCTVALRSWRSRLGRYLLTTSDGSGWLPDETGRTIRLGTLADGEAELLAAWSHAVMRLRARLEWSPSRSRQREPAHRLVRNTGDLP